jgi:hypothetical protein
MEEDPPQPRRLKLKAKEISPVDQVARAGDGTAISVQLMHKMNQLAAEKAAAGAEAGTTYSGAAPRPAAIPFGPTARTDAPRKVAEPDPGTELAEVLEPEPENISVQDMLLANKLAAEERDKIVAMPPRRRSRRRQDFALILGVGAAATGTLMLVFRHDAQLIGLGMFAIVFLTVILAWIMFGVMDRY